MREWIMHKNWIPILIIMIVVAVSDVSSASLMTYSSKSAFLSAAGTLSNESFEGLSVGDTGPFNLKDFSVTGSNLYQFTIEDFIPPDVNQALQVGMYIETSLVNFEFNKSITAFGIDIIDFGTVGSSPTLTYSNDIGDSFLIAVGPLPGANRIFFGAIADSAFNVATFTRSGTEAGDIVIYDDVHYSPIPEPSTILLLGTGLIGVVGLARRRKS